MVARPSCKPATAALVLDAQLAGVLLCMFVRRGVLGILADSDRDASTYQLHNMPSRSDMIGCMHIKACVYVTNRWQQTSHAD
jgi:hypothetical protein